MSVASNESPIILALDTQDIEKAAQWIRATNTVVKTFKVGLEFYLTHGRVGIDRLREEGDFDLFLDLKLHDIPNTVSSATKAVASIKPRFLTVHASGGADMVSAAVQAAPDIDITAVTVLTSLSGAKPIIITPGVRPVGSPLGDQTRVLTPKDAIAEGANFLVIGRPITSLETSALMLSKALEIMDSIY